MNVDLLLIEDNALISFTLKKLTEKFNKNISLRIFNDGEKVLNYILKLESTNLPKLILLDINIPIINSWQLLDRLESFNHSILSVPFFITSSSENIIDIEQSRKRQYIKGYLKKPLNKEQYFALLEEYLKIENVIYK